MAWWKVELVQCALEQSLLLVLAAWERACSVQGWGEDPVLVTMVQLGVVPGESVAVRVDSQSYLRDFVENEDWLAETSSRSSAGRDWG